MGDRRRITVEQFLAELKAQGVPSLHVAFKCCRCGTIQSMASLIAAGAAKDEAGAERFIGFSCIGRFTGRGGHDDASPPGQGCNWTCGGLFQFHELEVITPDGRAHPRFELTTPQEAQALMERHQQIAQAVGVARG